MADNIAITAGSGTNVKTDQLAGGEHVQYVKLMDGTADSSAVIPGDATNGLDVDVTRSALPTGASTAANQTTIIGHLDGVEGLLTTIDADTGAVASDTAAIKTAVETIDNAISGTEMQVDVVTSALPTGASTSAKQDSIITELQNIDAGKLEEGTFTGRIGEVQASPTANTVLDRLKTVGTHAATVAGAVSGTEMQVDVVTMPTVAVTQSGTWDEVGINDSGNSITVDNGGTFAVQNTNQTGDNTIGRVKITDGTDVADVLDLTNSNPLTVAIVDSSGNQISSFGGGTQYTEGDTDASITGTAMLWEDTSDTLRAVSAAKPLPVNIISGAGSGGTAMADDAAFTVGTTNVTPIAGIYRSTRDSVDNNDAGAIAMTEKRGILASLETPSGDSAMDETNDAVRVNIVTGTLNVGQSGGWATTVTTLEGGAVAHDSADIYNPLKIGGHAKATAPTAVSADGDMVNAWFDLNGRQAIFDGGGNISIDDGGNTITVDGTVAATQSGSWNATTYPQQWNGSAFEAILGNGTDGLLVNLGSNNDVTVTGDALTSLQLIDDVVKTDDAAFTPATDKVAMVGAQYDDTATDSVNEGDAGALRMSGNRNLYTQIRDAAGNERGANVDSNNRLSVKIDNQADGSLLGKVNLYDSSNSNAWQITSRSSGPVEGSQAHDAASTANPVKVGVKAETSMSGITLVADGDLSDAYGAEDGVQYVRDVPAHPSDFVDATPVTITSSTSDTSVVSAGGANVRVYITDAIIYNSSATDTRVSLKDGSGGTVKAILPAPTKGGVAHTFKTPLRGTANTAWHAACADSVASIYITLCGYKSKV